MACYIYIVCSWVGDFELEHGKYKHGGVQLRTVMIVGKLCMLLNNGKDIGVNYLSGVCVNFDMFLS